MRFPFFGRLSNVPVEIKLPDILTVGFGVYFRSAGEPPSDAALRAMAGAWIERWMELPMRGAALEYLQSPMLRVEVRPVRDTPMPPMDMLRAMGMGELEERRTAAATHLVMLAGSDAVRHPWFGLHSTHAAALGMAHGLNGVVYDAQTSQILPTTLLEESIPGDGRFALTQQIVIPFSANERGEGWMTTKGMEKFGLPNLQIKNVPPGCASVLMNAMNGVASRLISITARETDGRKEPLKLLKVGPEIRVGAEDVVRAYGKEDGEEDRPGEGVRGWSTVRLTKERSWRGSEMMLTIGPPAPGNTKTSSWLYTLLEDLFGSSDEVQLIEGGSETMETAHLRAVAELSAVKQRFQNALPPGTTLYMKHGFPRRGAEGEEFMWIAVKTWRGDQISGTLVNDPQYCLHLRVGQPVQISEAQVFDWLITTLDGAREGEYTTHALRGGEL
ncbi:DUF2314 domain-containing protein [Capsulimonas corticalis]|nr:DUF2314 domain-containing protein [Capsulimonas corticalis]